MFSRRLLGTCRSLSRLDQLLAIEVPGTKPPVVLEFMLSLGGFSPLELSVVGGKKEGKQKGITSVYPVF